MLAAFHIRSERPDDFVEIDRVNEAAFARAAEAQLVRRLRADAGSLSLVAVNGDCRVVGHAMFTPARIGATEGMALGPVAVVPEHQGRGIGSALIRAGIEQIQRLGCPFVIVLGHPDYYPRFGFEPAGRHGVHCKWDVPEGVFMIRILGGAPGGLRGLAEYHPAFDGV